MADIAAVLGFSLTEMSALSVTELAEWHERARVRSGASK